MKTKNPPANSYYWRAVKRIAKRKGISIQKARKLDWQKEVRAEHKRRSKSHIRPVEPKPKRVVSRTPKPKKVRDVVPRSPRGRSRSGGMVYQRGEPGFAPSVKRELEFRDYDRIPVRSEEDYEEETEFEDEWESGFNLEFPELNDMDDLDDFLDDIDNTDEDKYQEPA